MNNKNINSSSYQHYIPQCILKHFISTDPKWEKQRATSIFSVEENKWLKRRSITVTGGEPGLYDLDGKGVKQNIDKSLFEKEFSKLEREFSKIFNHKILHEKDLNKEDKQYMCSFLSLMLVRTPKHLDGVSLSLQVHLNEMSRLLANVTEERLKNNLPLPEGLEQYENNREFVAQMVNCVKQATVKVTPAKHFVFSAGLVNLFEYLGGIIYHMKWKFVENMSNEKFIISDNPVIVKNFRKPKHSAFVGGNGFLTSEAVKVYFPLTPKICFEGSWDKKDYLLTFIYTHDPFPPPYEKLVLDLKARNIYISPNEFKNIMIEHKKEGKAGYWRRKEIGLSSELYSKVSEGYANKVNKLSIENSYKYIFSQDEFPLNIKNYKLRKKSTKVFGNFIWTGEE